MYHMRGTERSFSQIGVSVCACVRVYVARVFVCVI
jgi:hypothetical protein